MLKIDAANLLSKEMDRKDFIKSALFGLIAMSGVAAALKAAGVIQLDGQNTIGSTSAPTASSYGTSAYGGRSEVR